LARYTPSSSAASPLGYERGGAEPIAGVFRDGDKLVAHRGADLSRFCICCGRPAAGKPIVRHLNERSSSSDYDSRSRDDGGIAALLSLVMLIASLWTYVGEWRASRTRTVTFGLCELHQRQRRSASWIIGVTFVAGLILLAGGTWGFMSRGGPAI